MLTDENDRFDFNFYTQQVEPAPDFAADDDQTIMQFIPMEFRHLYREYRGEGMSKIDAREKVMDQWLAKIADGFAGTYEKAPQGMNRLLS